MSIRVKFRDPQSWASCGNTYAWGTAFLGEEMLRKEELCRRFHEVADQIDAFRNLLQQLNGFYAVVHVADTTVHAAVDTIRSYPLFWSCYGGQFYIGDDARWIAANIPTTTPDPDAIREFRLVGYVTGNDTLIREVKQLRAGELIAADLRSGQSAVKQSFYFRHRHYDYYNDAEDELLDRLDQVMMAVFNRFVRYADERTISIPLSAGLDSRLIAIILRRLGYSNVKTYSYGVIGNKESAASRVVASKLGYDWTFVEYSKEFWQHWYQSEERRNYYEQTDGLCLTPYMSGWPAVNHLRDRGIIPEGSVFSPGLAADLPAGSYSIGFPGMYLMPRLNRSLAMRHIVECHYGLWPRSEDDHRFAMDRVIHTTADLTGSVDNADLFEEWFTLERVAKPVVNTVRHFEMAQYDWWLPYFDREFIEFWLRVPPRMRLGQRLYRKYIATISEPYFDSSIGSSKVSLKTLIRGGLKQVAEKLGVWSVYSKYKDNLTTQDLYRIYDNHHLGLWGMVPRDRFHAQYNRKQNIIAFLAEMYLEEHDYLPKSITVDRA